MSNSVARYLILIHAEADAQTPARVLALITQRNRLPERFSVRLLTAARIRIAMLMQDTDAASAEQIARRASTIPTVLSVACRWVSVRRRLRCERESNQ